MKTDPSAVAPSTNRPTVKVLLAHTPQMRRDYYGERSLNGLRAVADVRCTRATMRWMPPR